MIVYNIVLSTVLLSAVGYGIYLNIQDKPDKPFVLDTSWVDEDVIERFLSYRPLDYGEDIKRNITYSRVMSDFNTLLNLMEKRNFSIVTNSDSDHTVSIGISDTEFEIWTVNSLAHRRIYSLKHNGRSVESHITDRINNTLNEKTKLLMEEYCNEYRQKYGNSYHSRALRSARQSAYSRTT